MKHLSIVASVVLLHSIAGLALRSSYIPATVSRPPRSAPSAGSRRRLLTTDAPAAIAVILGALQGPLPALAATDDELRRELAAASKALADLPKLVGDQQWDPVRVGLRKPAVNALWNVADGSNTIRRLAISQGDPELLDAADDIARNLRDVDQIVYSNSFSMEGKMAGAGLRTDGGAVGRAGEGGGKYRIKEPQDLLRATVRQIDGVLSASN